MKMNGSVFISEQFPKTKFCDLAMMIFLTKDSRSSCTDEIIVISAMGSQLGSNLSSSKLTCNILSLQVCSCIHSVNPPGPKRMSIWTGCDGHCLKSKVWLLCFEGPQLNCNPVGTVTNIETQSRHRNHLWHPWIIFRTAH